LDQSSRIKLFKRWTKDKNRNTLIMGILNVTPDSFSDGGLYYDPNQALRHAEALIADGADILDIGGESTRPGSLPISADIELERVIPVLKKIREFNSDILISIDTTKSSVAKCAVENGADIINDISSFSFDSKMLAIALEYEAPLILMHMQGKPVDMQKNPHYNDIIKDIEEFFLEKIEISVNYGIKEDLIILDPGIGFGKSVSDNFIIISKLHKFAEMGHIILVGPSRKSFIGETLGLPVHDRLEGTLASIAISVMNGAKIVRVHDVKEVKRVVTITERIMNTT
tara:strand:- start:955 stop:1809 length:855 start_codon:yes stop_codon:yes gene_type:complete